VLTRPLGLADDVLRQALAAHWNVDVVSLEYLPVGFGSHHWDVHGDDGSRWFVTVDVLADRRWRLDASNDDVFARLSDALIAAIDIARPFVVAPVAPPARLGDEFCVALYPFVEGETHRDPDAIRALLAELHVVPVEHVCARRDDLTIQFRDALEVALEAPGNVCGPYAERTAALVNAHAARIRDLLARYDAMVPAITDLPFVVTHGEPHRRNTMLTADGWKLIDWDTCLLAPRERDLWHLGDTGTPALDFFRLRWDLSDIACFVQRLGAPHTGNADDEKSFRELEGLLAPPRTGPS
jgi:spectinomycin phosphotransferase/16S rRNA (guanine(1405)-N(7))-methyltransferase